MNISIIIPVYNAEKTIIDSIYSILDQSILDTIKYEIIIINDGSTDNTYKLLLKFKEKHPSIPLQIINQINSGVSKARNHGINIAKFDWIAFLDADDIWLKNKLEIQFSIINSNKNIDFIGCARNNEALSILGRKINSIYKATINDLLIKMFPQTSTALVKKSLLIKSGYYREDMTHSEDGELWVRLCSNGNFYYIPNSLVITGGGKSNFGESGLSANLKKMHLGSLKILTICLKNKKISQFSYIKYYIFYSLKYYRRIILSRFK